MPKLFTILLQVEEVALGPVMNVLDRTPGIARCDLLLGDAASRKPGKPAANGNGHANGHANGHEAAGKKAGTARHLMFRMLKTGPKKATDFKEAFEKDGRSAASYSYDLNLAHKAKEVKKVNGAWRLTKKGHNAVRSM